MERPQEAATAETRPWTLKLRDFSRRWVESLRALYVEEAGPSTNSIRTLIGSLQTDGRKKAKKVKDVANASYPNVDAPKLPEYAETEPRKFSKSLEDVASLEIDSIKPASIQKIQTPGKRQAYKSTVDIVKTPLPTVETQCASVTPSSTDTLMLSSREDHSDKRSPFAFLRYKKIQLPPTPSRLNISQSPASDTGKTPRRRHTMYETSPQSEVLKKVANLVLDRASLESKNSGHAKVTPRKLDYGLYSKFEGLRLIEVLTSELPEHIKSQLTDAEREKLELAFYSRLVSTGVLRSTSDKDIVGDRSPTVPLTYRRNQYDRSSSLCSGESLKYSKKNEEFDRLGKKLISLKNENERLEKELISLRSETERLRKLNKDAATTRVHDKCVKTSPEIVSPAGTSSSSPTSNDRKSASDSSPILLNKQPIYESVVSNQGPSNTVGASLHLTSTNGPIVVEANKKRAPPPPPMPEMIIPAAPPPMPEMVNPPPPPMPEMVNPPPPPPPMPGMTGPPPPPPPPMPGMTIPPPPPMLGMTGPPPPPMPGMTGPPPSVPGMTGPPPPPMPCMTGPPPPPILGVTGSLAPPPMPGTTGPLPPPPISALRKRPVNPTIPMKPLYWTRILVPPVPTTRESTTTVWAELEEEKDVDMMEFVNLFSRQVTERKLTKKKEDTVKSSKVQPAKILDSKRSRNVGILEKSLHVDFSEVENAVYNLDTSVINLEVLQQIYEVRATPAELEKIAAHEESNPDIPLDRPEAFLKRLAGIDHFSERMACLMFQSDFQDAISSVSSKLTNIKSICDYLSDSNSLKKVMALILTLGNYMNGGNVMRGQADGFHLEILGKLKDVKSKVPGITLLHYVVKARLAQEKDHNFDETLPLPVPEPADVEAASTINFEDIMKELERLENQLNVCKAKYDVVIESNPVNAKLFQGNMNTFFTSATTELKNENKALIEAKMKFKSVMQYYQFVPKGATWDTADPNQFFILWLNFCHDFKSIWKKEQQRLRKEKLEEEVRKRLESKRNIQRRKLDPRGFKARILKARGENVE